MITQGWKVFCYAQEREAIQDQHGALPMAFVKSIIFRYIMVYYNRQRIYTSNPGGWPPAIYRERMLSKAA
jgi:hypothetical protein